MIRDRYGDPVSGALILTGPPGAGKSSVLDALSTLLEIDEIPFGAIETEELARGWPWVTSEQWLPQLASASEFQRRAGRHLVLVVATTETEHELRAVIEAVNADQAIVVCLTAPPEMAARRVAGREPDSWPGKSYLIEHARKLAVEIPSLPGIDAALSTCDRESEEVAAELKELLVARGMLSGD